MVFKTDKNFVTKVALRDFAPEFARFNDDILFGENWNGEGIDTKTRCIITVVSLMSQGITDSSLKYHLGNAKSHGVTKEEIATIVTRTVAWWGQRKGLHENDKIFLQNHPFEW